MASNHVAFVTAGGLTNATVAHSLYGYCTTGASTVAKTVTMYKTGNTAGASWATGDLVHGLTITVRFQYSNTAANPTLNVNSTGAKPIYKYGTTVPGTTVDTSWPAQAVVQLTYDTLLNTSGCWVMNDHIDNTTYSSLTAASGGTDVSLVTTGEKYTWNNKADSSHTHSEYANQNAFSNVTVGSTTIAADSTTDTLTLTAGSNITLTPDATNDKVTIAATDTTYESKTAANGGTDVSLVTTGEKYTWNSKTSNTGTVTSVRVQATSPVQSSTSTAQSATLNTTISLASAYGDTQNPYGTKTANYVLAGPTSGNAAAPTFRKLVAADIPDLSGTYTTTDTKNTAGSTASTSKLFLIGATSQAANPQTYSRSTAYIGTDGHLYSNGIQVVNLSGSQALTNKTYNGYTLAAACAKGVDTSISSTTSTNLPTTAAVTAYTDDIIVIDENEPTSSLTKIWIKI